MKEKEGRGEKLVATVLKKRTVRKVRPGVIGSGTLLGPIWSFLMKNYDFSKIASSSSKNHKGSWPPGGGEGKSDQK